MGPCVRHRVYAAKYKPPALAGGSATTAIYSMKNSFCNALMKLKQMGSTSGADAELQFLNLVKSLDFSPESALKFFPINQ